MEEQVRSLRGKNVASYFITNSVTEAQKDEIIYALLFTSPEQLQSVKLQNALDLLKKQERLVNCFVDEAYCVNLWSRSFRSACSKLGFLKNKIGILVTALSGSATDQTVSAIQKSLSMSDNTLITQMSFSRENLSIFHFLRNQQNHTIKMLI